MNVYCIFFYFMCVTMMVFNVFVNDTVQLLYVCMVYGTCMVQNKTSLYRYYTIYQPIKEFNKCKLTLFEIMKYGLLL